MIKALQGICSWNFNECKFLDDSQINTITTLVGKDVALNYSSVNRKTTLRMVFSIQFISYFRLSDWVLFAFLFLVVSLRIVFPFHVLPFNFNPSTSGCIIYFSVSSCLLDLDYFFDFVMGWLPYLHDLITLAFEVHNALCILSTSFNGSSVFSCWCDLARGCFKRGLKIYF